MKTSLRVLGQAIQLHPDPLEWAAMAVGVLAMLLLFGWTPWGLLAAAGVVAAAFVSAAAAQVADDTNGADPLKGGDGDDR